jgi:CHRD domain
MKRLVLISSLAVAVLAVIAAGAALAHGDNGKGARLNGFQETPSVSTTGHGSFRARVRSDGIHYVLRYAELENDATVAHIHFGERHVAGGVVAFLCGGGDKPSCPLREGRVEGVIDMADVIGPAGQGIDAGQLREVIRALKHGAIYANVHTTKFGNGEIRGQVGHNGDNGDKRDKRK